MHKKKIQEIRWISAQELHDIHKQTDVSIIDVRPVEAYNGWRLHSEKRGGHIPGARSLPEKWTSYLDWIEIVENKKISKHQTIIIYGYDTSSSKKVAQHFLRAGYSDIKIYPDFVDEWSANKNYPLEHLPRYQHLVSAHWLHDLITTGAASEYTNNSYVLCHAHYQNSKAYTDGHVPKAVELDTNWLESIDTWNRREPYELQTTLETLGITTDTTVILYGRFSFPNFNDPFPGSSAGHLGAFRCAVIMLYAGVKDVRMLNGGLQAWKDAGYTTSTTTTTPKPVKEFGASIPQHPEFFTDLPQAKAILADPHKNLISVRSWKEYIGQVSGYHYIKAKGRIPGAVFGNCGSDAYHMENYRNLDHTTREYHEIKTLWEQNGITPEKHNAFYCGTGWRASEAFFNAWLMGWQQISVFDGGWFEWSSNNLSFETGEPTNLQQQKIMEAHY